MPIELLKQQESSDQSQYSTTGPILAILHPMSTLLTFGRSKFSRFICLGLVGGSALGCGGAVDTGQTGATGGSGSNASAGGSQSSGTLGDQTLLPECQPGFAPSQATTSNPCEFFVGTTCYSTQDEACACVCPRDQGPVLCIANANAYLAGTDAYGVWCVPKTS